MLEIDFYRMEAGFQEDIATARSVRCDLISGNTRVFYYHGPTYE